MRRYLGSALLESRLIRLVFTAFAFVTPLCAQQTDASGFSFKGDLWPSASFRIGSLQEIAIWGQARNESAQGASWRGFDPDSQGFGQLRLSGEFAPICETPHGEVRFGSWTNGFAIGTSAPILVRFDGLSCTSKQPSVGSIEARSCVNPHMFQLSTGEPIAICSTWIKVTLDPRAAAIRHDDTFLRDQFERLVHTGEPSDQQLALNALLVRARQMAPSPHELETIPVGKPDRPLATLWLEFFHAQATAITAFALTVGPLSYENVSPPIGCEPRQNDPSPCARTNPDLDTQYKRDIAENDRRIQAHSRLGQLQSNAQESLADFGTYMGSHYRRNRAAREELYVQARNIGLDEDQLAELRRFLELATK